jgi:hypothetical protein
MDALGAGQPVRAEMHRRPHSVIVVDTETPHVRHQKSIGHHFMCGYNPGTCDFSEKDIGLRTDYADPRWIQPSKNAHSMGMAH